MKLFAGCAEYNLQCLIQYMNIYHNIIWQSPCAQIQYYYVINGAGVYTQLTVKLQCSANKQKNAAMQSLTKLIMHFTGRTVRLFQGACLH